MHITYFTERPYRWLDEDDVLSQPVRSSPSRTARSIGARLRTTTTTSSTSTATQRSLGFDGVALNEHHGNPFCMGSVMNVEAVDPGPHHAQRAKIMLIGNPLPTTKHPLRMAEELATIDLISRGRLVTGWVRGAWQRAVLQQRESGLQP